MILSRKLLVCLGPFRRVVLHRRVRCLAYTCCSSCHGSSSLRQLQALQLSPPQVQAPVARVRQGQKQTQLTASTAQDCSTRSCATRPCLSFMSCSARERSVHSMSRIACRPSRRTERNVQRKRWHCHDRVAGLSAPAVPPCSPRGGDARLRTACRAPCPARPGAAEPVPAG